MAFNINQFSAEISAKGTARQSNFDVLFQLPSVLVNPGNKPQLRAFSSITNGIDYSLNLRCESIDFPGRSLQAIDGHRQLGFGTPVNVPYTASHLEVTATFLLSREFEEKEVFERWQDLIVGDYRRLNPNSQQTKFNSGYYDDIIKPCIMLIRQYDEMGVKMYEMELQEVYPRTINPITGNWAAGSEMHKLSVSFNYRHFVVKTEPIGFAEVERQTQQITAAEQLLT